MSLVEVERPTQPVKRVVAEPHLRVEKPSPDPPTGAGIEMAPTVTVVPVHVDVLRDVAHQLEVKDGGVELDRHGPRLPYDGLGQLPGKPRLP